VRAFAFLVVLACAACPSANEDDDDDDEIVDAGVVDEDDAGVVDAGEEIEDDAGPEEIVDAGSVIVEPIEGSGFTEGAVASAACNDLCVGVGSEAEFAATDEEQRRFAACFSCRCRESIGFTPPPEELQCSGGTPLERYRFEADINGVVTGLETLDTRGFDTEGCLNGGIAAAGCDLLSRHKRIISPDGTAEYQLLCRQPTEASIGYYEYLIIGTNTENGATCFWQSRDFEFNGEDTAALDVLDDALAPIDAAVTAYVDTYYLYSAGPSTCTACHASDAFLWSPYFASAYAVPVDDETALARLAAPYFQVRADSERLQPVNHEFLRAGPAAPGEAATPLGCTACHRVANGSFCDSFSWQALGQSSRNGVPSFDPASAFAFGADVAFWMPPNMPTHEDWLNEASADIERIRACCAESFDHPDADCVWSDSFEPLP
jgi:hypothetical protein